MVDRATQDAIREAAKQNPFRMPSDEEIFSLRDEERARKEEERKRFLTLPVHEKTTWSSRAGSTSKNVFRSEPEDVGLDEKTAGKLGSLNRTNAAYRQERHREKENMADFIEKKRQMFLVQMSLDTKRAEIRKLEEQAQQREEALKKSEDMLKEDESRFEAFLKSNDQKAVEAIRKAEQETKMKQDKVQEIKKLNAQIAAIKSEMAKYEESLDECQAYKKFLDELTPPEYVKDQKEAHEQERLRKIAERKEARQTARAEQDRALEEAFNADMETLRGVKGRRADPKTVQAREGEYAAARAALAKEREAEDRADEAWDPDGGKPFQPPMYFRRPQQLLEVFAGLEERNLLLIQNSQETEEQVEDLRHKLHATRARMDQHTTALKTQAAGLQAAIVSEEGRAAALRQPAVPAARAGGAAGPDAGRETEAQLEELQAKVAAVYLSLSFEQDSSLSTLMMLSKMEARLEECLALVAAMPPDEVERAEKDRDRARRARLRDDKLAAQRRAQEERVTRSLERSKAPVHKPTGKPLMFRAPPAQTRARVKEVKEERDPDADDLREFLAP